MLDPITLYAAKIGITSAAGGILTAIGVVQAQTAVDPTSVVTVSAGIGLLAAGAWKLLADHTAVERERATLQAQIEELRAEVTAAEARAAATATLLQAMREHVLRVGIDPDTLTGFRDHRPEEDTP